MSVIKSEIQSKPEVTNPPQDNELQESHEPDEENGEHTMSEIPKHKLRDGKSYTILEDFHVDSLLHMTPKTYKEILNLDEESIQIWQGE